MIWNYADYLTPFIPEEFRLSGASDETTPIYKLAPEQSIPLVAGRGIRPRPLTGSSLAEGRFANIWIKDESDRGTHKDRSFQYWISYYAMQGAKELVVSSSGSSAIAAAFYCEKSGIKLHAFLRQKFQQAKVEQLERMGVCVHLSSTPKRDAIQMSNTDKLPLLRASVDPLAIEGYKTLAFEIAEALPDAEEIFLPVSSAATLVGIYQGYKIQQEENTISMPRLYAIQTSMVHPIAEEFDSNFEPEQTHPARALIDRISHRKSEVIEILKETKGGGYVISAEETKSAQRMLEEIGNPHGPESATALAGLRKHRAKHPEYAHAKAVVVFTN